jgi:hypothetical protein
MKFNTLMFAVVNAGTGEILGDGECAALTPYRPSQEDLNDIAHRCNCDVAIVQCEIVKKDSGLPACPGD